MPAPLQAYLAARKALQVDPSNSKARYRLARCLLHLRCYGPALAHLKAVRQQVSRVLWQCSSQFCAWCGEWCVLLAAAGGWQLLLTAAGWLHSLLLLMAGCLQVGPHDKSVAELLRAAEALAGQSQGRLDTAAILSGKQAPSGAPLLADWVGPIEVFPSPIAGAPCCRRACLIPLQAEAKDRLHAPGNLWNALTCPPAPRAPPPPARLAACCSLGWHCRAWAAPYEGCEGRRASSGGGSARSCPGMR